MTTHYQAGYAFERRVLAYLESLGYHCRRTAGSHTVVDITAVHKGEPYQTLIVQSKRTGLIGHSEWNSLYNLSVQTKETPILAKMPDGKTRGIEIWLLLDRAVPNERDRLKNKAKLIIYKK